MCAKQIQIIPSQIERPSVNGGTTLRGTYTNLPYNQDLLKRLNAIVDSELVGDLNLFKDEYPVPSLIDLQKLLSQIIIRFDNDPSYYTKRDYQYLIWYLCQILQYAGNSENGATDEDIHNLFIQLENLSKRVDELEDKTDRTDNKISELEDLLKELQEQIDDVPNRLPSQEVIGEMTDAINTLFETKQDKLASGSGIDITDNTISAVVTDGDIQVINTKIGKYDSTNSDTNLIPEGTPIIEVLKGILQKLIDVKAVAPTCQADARQVSFEYGWPSNTTKIPIKLTSQGYFQAVDTTYGLNKQPMTCLIKGVQSEYKTTNGDIDWSTDTPTTSASISITYDTTKYQNLGALYAIITENETKPVQSDGVTPSKATYTNTKIYAGSLKLVPHYYVFYGTTERLDLEGITSEEIRDLRNPGDFDIAFPLPSTVTINNTVDGGGKSIMIACPAEYKLTKVFDGAGVIDYTDNFSIQKQVNVTCGNQQVPYNVYLYSISNGTTQSIKNMTFTKK